MVKFSSLLSALCVFAADSFRVTDEHDSGLEVDQKPHDGGAPTWDFSNVMLGSDPQGPLIPGMVPPPNTSFAVQNRERLDILESNEYRWAFTGIMQGNDVIPINQWFARLDGSYMGNLFGHRRVEVCNNAGTPIFAIEMAKYTWNPLRLSWSFRIRHTITDEILFTINKDWIGAGFLFLRDEWRIYRGRRRDGQQIYHMTSSYLGYSHRFYHEKPFSVSLTGQPVAEATQHLGRYLIGLPDVVSLIVHEGEDTALLLAATVIVDMVHESEQAARQREEEAEAENPENSALLQIGSNADVWSEEAMAKAEKARR